EISRLREITSSAIVASTKGAMLRYSEIEVIGVASALTSPTTSAAKKVTTSDLSPAIRAAARDEITRKVRLTASRPTRSESSSPETPERIPQTSQACASTQRTGPPTVAVISRS